MTSLPNRSAANRDPKGSTPRGFLRLGADILSGGSSQLPGETALQHAQRLQAAPLRPCSGCGVLTSGSIGAAGYKWPSVCPTCKEAADRAVAGCIGYQRNINRLVAGAVFRDDGEAVAGTLPLVSIGPGGIGHPDSREIHAPASPVTPKHLCPKCGDECPMDFIADRRICETCGLDGELPAHPCPDCGHGMTFEKADTNFGADADGNRGRTIPAGWACECGHFEPRVSSGRR